MSSIIIVQGYLAAGKSTFARELARELSIPCFVKDTFKIALCQSVQIDSREVSSRFSAVTFDGMVYAAERLMEAGFPLILEGNFLPAGVKKTDEAGVLRELIARHGCRSLTFKFCGEIGELYERFAAREGTPERGRANTMFTLPTLEEFTLFCRNMDGFDAGGEVITVDTSDSFKSMDFNALIAKAREFVERR
ncbi:MAG: ATP-binding protein [Oscillospiraceae bacterium]|nr:ATP-binding protein [Oscillospiraceae bacterium]